MNCSSQSFQPALRYHLVDSDGQPVHGISPYCCGRRECPSCRTKRAKGTATDYRKSIEYLRDNHGLKRVWTIVFTLPDGPTARNVKHAGAVMDAARDVLKRYWPKRRPGGYLCLHQIGGQDILRTRLHVHALMIPMRYDAGQWSSMDDGELLDVDRLRTLWEHQLRRRGLLAEDEHPINPEIRFFPVDEPNIGRLAHRLSYDLRSFWRDIEDAVLGTFEVSSSEARSCESRTRVVLKGTKRKRIGRGHRRVVTEVDPKAVPLDDVVGAWLKIVAQTPRLRTFGFMHRLPPDLKAHLQHSSLDIHLTDLARDNGRIERERRMLWDRKTRKVVRVSADYWVPRLSTTNRKGIVEHRDTGPPVLIDGQRVRYLPKPLLKRLEEDYRTRYRSTWQDLMNVLGTRVKQAEDRLLAELMEAEAFEDQRRAEEGWFYDPHGGPGGEGAWVHPDLDDEDLEALEA